MQVFYVSCRYQTDIPPPFFCYQMKNICITASDSRDVAAIVVALTLAGSQWALRTFTSMVSQSCPGLLVS